VAGAFLAPGRDPVYVLPRMVVDFHLDGVPPPGARVVKENGDGRASFAEAVRSLGEPQRIALGQRVWAETVIELLEVVPESRFSQGSSLVNELRRVKSPAELELMSHACLIAREAMDAVVPDVVAGVSMTTLVERVEHELRVRGSRSPSFPTHIFTWGERRLDSDGAGKLDALQAGEIVLFDFGAVWQGYCSDFGRTVACGKPPRD
jgi:Xaa-Pro aminopeptidase